MCEDGEREREAGTRREENGKKTRTEESREYAEMFCMKTKYLNDPIVNIRNRYSALIEPK